MDVSLTDEQLEWQAALARLAEAQAVTNPDQVSAAPDRRSWGAVLELGIPALRFPEHAGVESAGVESALAVEQFGRHLSTSPITGQGVIGPQLLRAARAADAIAAVLAGELRVAPAFTADLGGLARHGEPAVAFDAIGATHAVLLGDGAGTDRLVAVPLSGLDDIEGLDLSRRLVAIGRDVAGEAWGGPVEAEERARVETLALTALSADLLGVMDGAVDDAVGYAGDRQQFGVPIGTFQAVQHLLADAAVLTEGARGCVWHAAWAGDHLGVDDALLAARAAKAYCSAAALRAVEISVQVFGGIAITWEHRSHLRLRRVHLDRRCLGDEQVHHRAIARARQAIGSAA